VAAGALADCFFSVPQKLDIFSLGGGGALGEDQGEKSRFKRLILRGAGWILCP